MNGRLPELSDPAPVPRDIAVIGAGLVGLGCALFLQRDGHKVTLYDPKGAGLATSYGNAGGVVVSSVMPLATPAMIRKVPAMLLDGSSALRIRWPYLTQITPWLWDLLSHAKRSEIERLSGAMANLGRYSAEAWMTLADDVGETESIRPVGWLKVYRSTQDLADTAWERELAERHNVRLDLLNPDELRQLEPNLAPIFAGALFNPDSRFVVNPGRISQTFADHFTARGGAFIAQAVEDFREDDKGLVLGLSNGGDTRHDLAVVAAGAWSKRFRDRLGVKPRLDTERGYHLMLPSPEKSVNRPVSDQSANIAISPMEQGLRVVSMVEFGGLDLPPDYSRIEKLFERAREALPSIDTTIQSRWMGYRPSHPDSLPVIDWAPKSKRLLCAFGHAHLGLTQGPVTGRLIADLVAGRQPLIPLEPYAGDRLS